MSISTVVVDWSSHPNDGRLHLTRHSEAIVALLNAISALRLVHLDLSMKQDFLLLHEHGATKHLSGFRSLRSLRLRIHNLKPTADPSNKFIRTILHNAPHIEKLDLGTSDESIHGGTSLPAAVLFDHGGSATSRPSALRSLSIEGSTYKLTRILVSDYDAASLEELILSDSYLFAPLLAEEGFWHALAEKARSTGGIQIKRLRCQGLSTAVINFLSSFAGLQSLGFTMSLCTSPVSRVSGQNPVIVLPGTIVEGELDQRDR